MIVTAFAYSERQNNCDLRFWQGDVAKSRIVAGDLVFQGDLALLQWRLAQKDPENQTGQRLIHTWMIELSKYENRRKLFNYHHDH